jgi:hypothetical protein
VKENGTFAGFQTSGDVRPGVCARAVAAVRPRSGKIDLIIPEIAKASLELEPHLASKVVVDLTFAILEI